MHDDECEYGPEVHERAAKLAGDTAPWARAVAFAFGPIEDSIEAIFGVDDHELVDDAMEGLPATSLPFALKVAHDSLMEALSDLFDTMTDGDEAEGVFSHWIDAMAALHVGQES